VGATALLEVLSQVESDSAEWTPQEPALATYAAKVTKDDVALSPELTAAEAYRRVRASTKRAPARACLGDRELTVITATATEEQHPAGSACLVDGRPVLGFASGSLALDTVRPSGKGDMPGVEWARGARLGEDVCWRCTR